MCVCVCVYVQAWVSLCKCVHGVCVSVCVCAQKAELPYWDHLPNSIKQDQSDLDLSVLHDYKSHIVTPDPGR